jgi:hypothetical protein
MKYWELIADKLSASGWSWGCSSQIATASDSAPEKMVVALSV